MRMSESEELRSTAAIQEIRSAEGRVRSRARRWAVRYWLTVGIAIAVFYVAGFLIDLGLWFPLGWLAICVAAFGFQERRRDVIDPEQNRIAGPLFVAYFGLALLVILADYLTSDDSLRWAAPLGVVPAVPFFYGAWKAWRR
jgi:hypothetical protein